jgi:putative membrane protein insertion efficiency factor
MAADPVPSRVERLSVAQRSALALLALYKILLSPLFTGSCRFLPSCSDYAREAVSVHGAVKGVWLAARRLSRCHPLGSSGLDPVPRRSGRASTRT